MSEFLTEEQVAELPEGAKVVITWSGGNGPHTYEIHQCAGQTYAWSSDLYLAERLKHYNPITFVGAERFHTRVSLA